MDQELLLERLVEEGLVSRVELGVLMSDPRYRDLPLERLLVEQGLVDENRLLPLMAEVYGIPLVHLSPEELDTALASRLPTALLKNFNVYPLRSGEEGLVRLAMADPFDVQAEDAVRYLTGCRVERALSPRAEIQAAREGRLGMETAGIQSILDRIPHDADLEYIQAILEQPTEEEQSHEAAPVIALVNSLISDAIGVRASDIHVEPLKTGVRVRYRVDGLLRTVVELPKRVQGACITRLKLISGIDISESRRHQDGRSRARTRGKEVDLRVSTIPTFYGEKVVLRILDQSAAQVDLSQLGLLPRDYQTLRDFLRSSHGMVLITGPTGSGKTSTLYAALSILNKEERNIVTVEDPVEYQLEGVNQVQVAVKAGVTFAKTLRSILRQDPDVVMVGEVRDLETAEIAVQAAQTGHLVFSTLHTNDSPSTLTRLILMGLEPYMVTSSLLCVIAQRLVRKLCPACRKPAPPDPELVHLLSLAAEHVTVPETAYQAVGCPDCDNTGYKGRTGLFEILVVTDAVREEMLRGDVSEERLWRLARREGMHTLLEDGLLKVGAGVTSLEEVMRVVTIKREGSMGERSGRPPGLQQVAEVMTPAVLTVRPDSSLADLVTTMLEHRVTGVPVIDQEGLLVGIVSFTDIAVLGHFRNGKKTEPTVAEIMSPRVFTVTPEADVLSARDLLLRHRIHRLVVAKEGRPVGIISAIDLCRLVEGK